MNNLLRVVVAAGVAALSIDLAPVAASVPQVSSCAANYPGGSPPRILRASLSRGTRTLCFASYAVVHSAPARAPLVSSTYLTPKGVEAASNLPRVDVFYPEPRLPRSERSEIEDYAGNGLELDRGHMTASADAPSQQAQAQTFSLANIVPQAANLNRESWMRLEVAVRRTARRTPVYVATGPLYEGARLRTVGRVIVPTAVWKAVLVPGRGGQAWIATNSQQPVWRSLSIAELSARTGIDPFPAIPAEAKARAVRVVRYDHP